MGIEINKIEKIPSATLDNPNFEREASLGSIVSF